MDLGGDPSICPPTTSPKIKFEKETYHELILKI
jgi:hypothetical protein